MFSTRPLIFKSSSLCINFWWLYQEHLYNWYHRQFHVPQFYWFPSKVKVLIFLFAFFQFYSVVNQDSKVLNLASSIFVIRLYLEIPGECVCLILQDKFCVMHIPFFSYGQISISCIITCGLPGPPSRVYSYTLSVQAWCIHLLCDWLFCLCHNIIYICYFVTSYLFLPLIGPYGVVLCCYQWGFIFFLEVSLS